jgi:hypothetical protein
MGPVQPIRSDERFRLLRAIAQGLNWLDELINGACPDITDLAKREGKTERTIRMMISLAFLDPALVKTAAEGRLPRGYGISRLTGLRWPGRINGAPWVCRNPSDFAIVAKTVSPTCTTERWPRGRNAQGGNQGLIAANQACIEPVSVLPNPSLDGVQEESAETNFAPQRQRLKTLESPAKSRQKLGQRPKIRP